MHFQTLHFKGKVNKSSWLVLKMRRSSYVLEYTPEMVSLYEAFLSTKVAISCMIAVSTEGRIAALGPSYVKLESGVMDYKIGYQLIVL